jgi:hypothetical protein
MNKRVILRLMARLSVLMLGLGLISASAFGSVSGVVVCQVSTTNACPGFATGGIGVANPQLPGPFTATITETGSLQFLPFFAFGGDVVIMEPTGAFSDDVQFNSGVLGFGNDVFMFSEQESPFDPLDVPLPPGFIPSPNAVFATEAGTEPGPNGLIYKVISPDGHVNAVYTIISDVPEPGTLSLLGIGGLALFNRLRRKS